MVSEQAYPRRESVGNDWVGNSVSVKSPNLFRPVAADYGGDFVLQFRTAIHRRWQEFRAQALHRPAALPSRFQSESALEPYLPRQIPDSSDLRRRRGPAELALAVSGPDRREVKVPHSTPGKIPNPSSNLGKMTKSAVRYEVDASDPTAVWRIVQFRPSEKPRDSPDLIPSAEWENDKTRRSVELRQITLKSTQGKQWMGAPEGNFNPPSTGCSAVPSGWSQNQLPPACLVSPNLNGNGSEKDALSAMDKNADSNEIDEIQKDESALKGSDAKTKSNDPNEAHKAEEKKGVNESEDEDKINKGDAVKTIVRHNLYPLLINCLIEGEEVVSAIVVDAIKCLVETTKRIDIIFSPDGQGPVQLDKVADQLYMGKRVDRGLRSNGLRWNLPPWPDFCIEELTAVYKSELMKMRHEVEEERMMLQRARVWRVERVQRKLVVAKLTVDSKYAPLNKLQSDLEEFLSFHRGNSVDEEIHKSAEESGDSLIAKKCLGMPKAMRSHHEYNYVDYRKGIGVVCNKKGGFGVDDRWLWSTGLLWTLPPWPDLSLCEADWMALDIEKGAAAMYLRRAAMFGGIVGQEVVQACSGKFHPVYQFFYIDSVESLSVEPLEYGDLKPESTIYAVQISISGSKLQKELEKAKVFMGGSGALGCEFLKNLALMGSVTARMYIDSRCVYFQKPLPESGFLGAKCNTQMTKPHLTENHGASRDPPEKQAPMCTVHSFLHNIDHCLTWARSEFEGLLEKTPIEVNAFLPNPTGYAIASRTARDQLKCVIECLHGEKCETFQDCITWTRLKFEDYLLSRVKQLMFTFPEDSMTNSGTPSWSAPRRSPRPLEFTPTELSQLNLVLTASILRAETFVIPIPYWAFTFSSFTKMFASKLGVDDINATAIRNCDLEGSFMLNISKMISVPDRGRFFAFGSVFSREVAAGKRDLYAKNVQSSAIWRGKKQGSVENVFCGNTFVMVGFDQLTTKNATLTNEREVDVCLIRTMTFSVFPVVLIAAQCRIASDFPKLIEGLKLLAKFDSTVLCTMEESDEHLKSGAGELHLGNCLKDLLKKFLWRMLILLRNIPRIVCTCYQILGSRSILEDKYAVEEEEMSEPSILKQLKKALKSEEKLFEAFQAK